MNDANQMNFFARITVKTFVAMVIGVIITGLGNCLLRLSTLGTDPYGCMNLGVSSHLPISYGTTQLICGFLLFIPVLFCYRKSIGLGTILNMAVLGYISDFCMYIANNMGITEAGLHDNMVARVLYMIAGIVALAFGLALYMDADLGTASYDSLPIMITMWTKEKVKFTVARMACDITCMVVGIVSGAVFGIATIAVAFGLGPLITFFRKTVSSKML